MGFHTYRKNTNTKISSILVPPLCTMPEQKYPKPPDISFSAMLVWEEESPAHLSSERKRPTKLTTHPQSIPHVAVTSLDRLFYNT
jgi:hypothetical protein